MGSNILWVLVFLLWGGAVSFGIYAWVIMQRQQQVFRHILARLERLDEALLMQKKKEAMKKTALSIPKDEPVLKYASVSLPDDVEISFVEK